MRDTCPECKSTEVTVDDETGLYCYECGYSEEKDSLDSLQNLLKIMPTRPDPIQLSSSAKFHDPCIDYEGCFTNQLQGWTII